MTSFLYDSYRQKQLENAGVAWLTDPVKAVLIDTAAYTPSKATHANLSDIPAGARISTTTVATAGRTSTAGVADSADITFMAVSGPTCEAVALYKDTGTAATSSLICYVDQATGLPATPGGGDIIVMWDNGVNKIFAL